MASDIQYEVRYKKNTGAVLSPAELRELYLYGINLKSRDGSELPYYVWEQKILSAQQQIEKFLAIKLRRQLVTESLSYYRDDYLNNLPIINTSFPVAKVIRLLGLLNNVEQILYPIEWGNYYQCTDGAATRRVSIVPSGTSVGASTSVILMGVTAQLGIRSLNIVPNYWTVSYLSGYAPDKLPADVVDMVGKLSAIQILAIMGDLVLSPGLSGQTLSIDGLSQSIQTPVGAHSGAFAGRIAQYTDDLKITLERLRGVYVGINWVAL